MSDSIQANLKAFAKQPGCDGYKGDAKQIDLVCLYLTMRQLTPSLPFEDFLRLYTPLADADDKNLKLPETAVDMLLPRTAAKATRLGSRQWSAKEVVGFLALYVDMIREAEATNTPVPMTLNQWIGSPAIQQQYISGAFDVAEQPTEATVEPVETSTTEVVPAVTAAVKTRKSKAKTKTATLDEKHPTTAGQRVLYKHPSGQHVRGVTRAVNTVPAEDGQRVYVTLMDDSGQLHEDVSCLSVVLIDDPLPQAPQNVAAPALVITEKLVVDLTAKEIEDCSRYLGMTTGNSKLDDDAVVWGWDDITTQEGVEYCLHIELKNGDSKSAPYIDAYATYYEGGADTNKIVFEIPPRNFAILGAYMFVLPAGTVQVCLEKETVTE